jgi:drug/metabolite transporter (DMT)-like permease
MTRNGGLIPRKGFLYVVLAAIMWAVSGSSGKFLFHQGVTVFELVQFRLTFSVVFLFLLLLAVKPALLRISPRDLLYFAVLGVTGLGLAQFAYFLSISKINVAVAILLEYLAPVFIAIYYAFIAPEKLTRMTLVAISLSVAGCYLVVGAYNVDLFALNWQGIAAGILAGAAFAWYTLYGEKGMQKYDPWTVVFYATIFAAILFNIVLPPFRSVKAYSGVEWFWLIYIVVFGSAVPFALFAMGVSLIRSTRASVTATLEPIAAAFIAFFFLGECLEVLQILGGILTIISVILLQLRPEYDENTSAIIRGNNAETAARGANESP